MARDTPPSQVLSRRTRDPQTTASGIEFTSWLRHAAESVEVGSNPARGAAARDRVVDRRNVGARRERPPKRVALRLRIQALPEDRMRLPWTTMGIARVAGGCRVFAQAGLVAVGWRRGRGGRRWAA